MKQVCPFGSLEYCICCIYGYYELVYFKEWLAFQEIKFSSYELQFLHTTYLSSIFSKILHTKSYTTYQKFSSYLVSFQKIYLCFFLLLSGPIQIGTPHLETVIQGPCPVHGWCQRYNLAVRGAWWLYVAFIINFDHSNSLSGLCSYRYAFEISHQCASASADNGPY